MLGLFVYLEAGDFVEAVKFADTFEDVVSRFLVKNHEEDNEIPNVNGVFKNSDEICFGVTSVTKSRIILVFLVSD